MSLIRVSIRSLSKGPLLAQIDTKMSMDDLMKDLYKNWLEIPTVF